MYDFPRSHQVEAENSPTKPSIANRHCYNNAAPSMVDGHIFRYDITATENMSHDPSIYENTGDDVEPASPCSQSSCSTTALYSNLPSPSLLVESQVITMNHLNDCNWLYIFFIVDKCWSSSCK